MACGHGIENSKTTPSDCKHVKIIPRAHPVVSKVVPFDVNGEAKR